MNKNMLVRSTIQLINLEAIEPNPFQPRKTFLEDDINSLAESIRTNGLLQKITVVPQVDKDFKTIPDKYYIISGERRFRAYKKLFDEAGERQYGAIEAVVMPLDELTPQTYDERLMIDSILENVDRVDLTPVEKAESIIKIKQLKGLTNQQIAEKLGKKEGYIKNILSQYGQLDEEERELVKKEKLGTRKIKEMIDKKKEKDNPQEEKVQYIGDLQKDKDFEDEAGIAKSEEENIPVSKGVETTSIKIYAGLSKEEKYKELSKFLESLLGTEDFNEKYSFLLSFAQDYSE